MNWISLLGLTDQKGHYDKSRSTFESDYDKVIFSNSFRRLQDKTQVFPLPEHDFVHTRLTHSLETSSVGRSLGKEVGQFVLGKHPEISELGVNRYDFGAVVASACLAHDIGNPPFGHSGEDAISEFYRCLSSEITDRLSDEEKLDLLNFEGNAQGFRLLSTESNKGLKMSPVTLAAFTKYPCESRAIELTQRKSQKKFGFFQTEKSAFLDIASKLELHSLSSDPISFARHPLGLLVEAADDICYGIIDFEDGCRLGFINMETYTELLSEIIGDRFDPKKLKRYNNEEEKLAVLRALAINQLVKEVVREFIDREPQLLIAEHDQALTDTIPSKAALSEISKISVKNIYQAYPVVEREAAGFQVINGILNGFTKPLHDQYILGRKTTARQKNLIRLFPEDHKNRIMCSENISTYQLLMIINDYVSGMTDSQALGMYKVLSGQTINSYSRFIP